ncbi:MAG: Transcription factor zinc-finger [Myxococcales bacterium]|nr:Transcription factor zinc-finger [Myxococcales bacterium]
MKCPIDQVELDLAGRTFKCNTCDGAWVLEDVLVAMLEQSASTLVALPWKPRPVDQIRPCATCGAAMQTVSLGTVALDRCAEHGVWFDAHELADILGQAKQFKDKTPTPHESLLHRLAHVFKH